MQGVCRGILTILGVPKYPYNFDGMLIDHLLNPEFLQTRTHIFVEEDKLKQLCVIHD